MAIFVTRDMHRYIYIYRRLAVLSGYTSACYHIQVQRTKKHCRSKKSTFSSPDFRIIRHLFSSCSLTNTSKYVHALHRSEPCSQKEGSKLVDQDLEKSKKTESMPLLTGYNITQNLKPLTESMHGTSASGAIVSTT